MPPPTRAVSTPASSFTCPDPETSHFKAGTRFPCGGAALSPTLCYTFARQTLWGSHSAEAAASSAPHIVGNKGIGLMGQTRVCGPSL